MNVKESAEELGKMYSAFAGAHTNPNQSVGKTVVFDAAARIAELEERLSALEHVAVNTYLWRL